MLIDVCGEKTDLDSVFPFPVKFGIQHKHSTVLNYEYRNKLLLAELDNKLVTERKVANLFLVIGSFPVIQLSCFSTSYPLGITHYLRHVKCKIGEKHSLRTL